ncbi:hypothetical protein [Lelliottia wanjuensis]|uniref:Uncharacterized protein n=1 Tax=Lelliottia wanjuensis TaxID=3050585 RepID=A0AAP4FXE9_9ENTR|nr:MULTISPECIES: hypothetical protein [unclassified Lelliottia]MDK9365469.1 hypothetical protein [Lelliottia sp. V106_12]MDK9587280.1 hypothetical protein [Lelliottia sp. V86_10]MDK9615371.1 hypothetical protein [Lelliottia sp. V106_9]
MNNKESTRCPRCNESAEGILSIEMLFGFRNLRGQKKPQSHCRACRIEELRLSRQLAA